MGDRGDCIVREERTFGHSIVTWEILNYGRLLWQKCWEVQTPDLLISGPKFQSTKWRLKLETKMQEIELDKSYSEWATHNPTDAEFGPAENYLESTDLVLHLQRYKSESEPQTVRVNWKAFCLGVDGKKFAAAEGEHYFDGEITHSLNLGTIFDTEREISFKSGAMTLICQMIVTDSYYCSKCDSNDFDFCALSEDLHSVFKEKKGCDLVIRISDKSIYAHKALLSARSSNFKLWLAEDDKQTFNLTGVEYDAMMRVLEYIYSGDIRDIIEIPSIPIHRCLVYSNLSDLVTHYDPEQAKVRTNLDCRKFTHVWRISNFSGKENGLSSPIVSDNTSNAAWQIHLRPKGLNGESEYAAVVVEYIQGLNEYNNIDVQCAIVEDGKESLYWKTIPCTAEGKFENENFMKLDMLLKKRHDDTLKLGLKVRIYLKGKNISFVKKDSKNVPFTVDRSLKKLSEDLKTLLDSKNYADLNFQAGNQIIKAHKFLVSARSVYLSKKLDDIQTDSLYLPDVKPAALNIALEYMYCAELNVTDVALLLDVYKFADYYIVSRLKDKCIRVLKSCFTVDTICEVLILADSYKDYSLLEAALEFCRLNKDAVEKLEDWKKVTEILTILCEIEMSSSEGIPKVPNDDITEIKVAETPNTSEKDSSDDDNVPKDDVTESNVIEKVVETPNIQQVYIGGARPKEKKGNETSTTGVVAGKTYICPGKEAGSQVFENVMAQTDSSSDLKIDSISPKKSSREESSASEILECGATADQSLDSIGITATKDEAQTHGDSSTNLESESQTGEKDSTNDDNVPKDDITQSKVTENVAEIPYSDEEDSSDDDNFPVILYDGIKEVRAKTPYTAEIRLIDGKYGLLDRRRKYLSLPTRCSSRVAIEVEKEEEANIRAQRQTDDDSNVRTTIVHENQVNIGGARPKEKKNKTFKKKAVAGKQYFWPGKHAGSQVFENVMAQKDSSSDLKIGSKSEKRSIEDSCAGGTFKDCSATADLSLRYSGITDVKAEMKAQGESDSKTLTESPKKSSIEDSSAGEILEECGVTADQSLESSGITDTKDEAQAHGDSSTNLESESQIDKAEEGSSTSSINLAETTSKGSPKHSSSPQKQSPKHSSSPQKQSPKHSSSPQKQSPKHQSKKSKGKPRKK